MEATSNEFIGVREARAKFGKLVKDSSEKLEKFIITSRGKPEAVIIGIDEYEELIETVNDLSNKKLIKEIGRARADYKDTGGISYDEYRSSRQKY